MNKKEEDLKQQFKIVLNRLHAAGQLFVEQAKGAFPKDEKQVGDAMLSLWVIQEITTNIPRAFLQLMHNESDKAAEGPIYNFARTVFPATVWTSWGTVKKQAKSAFKSGKKLLADQLETIEHHLEDAITLMEKLPWIHREVMAVHKVTGVILGLEFDTLSESELKDFVLICPHLVPYWSKYTDGVLRHSSCDVKTKKAKAGTVVYKVPKAYWSKKGKSNSPEFESWLKLVEKEILTSYDLSYNENL